MILTIFIKVFFNNFFHLIIKYPCIQYTRNVAKKHQLQKKSPKVFRMEESLLSNQKTFGLYNYFQFFLILSSMSKKDMSGSKSFKTLKTLKTLKLDEPTTNLSGTQKGQKSKKIIPSKQEQISNKRREKRLLKSIKNLKQDDDQTRFQHFSIIQKQQNSIDKNLLAKSLSTHFAFSSLVADKSIRDMLIEQFKLCRVSEGDYLIKQNDEASSFFVLHDGKMLLEIDGEVKKKFLPGQCFGQLALLYSCLRSASIKAQKNSYLWFIDRKTFKFAIEENIKKNFHENRKFIEKNQFFEYLTPIQKDKIASISMTQKFEKNSKLFKEGDLASSMYIVKEGTLKRFVNGISIGYYQKGQSLQEYAVISRDCLRKETVVAMTDVQLIALSIEEIQETLGKSLPIIILRNKVKKELKRNQLSCQLSNEYINKILDSFQIKNTLLNERVCHPGLKCKQLLFIVIQGNYEATKQSNSEMFGLECFSLDKKDFYYDFELKFLEQGRIAWTNLHEIQKALGKSIAKCISLSSEIKKVNFQRRSQLMELKSFAEKYELGSLEAVKKLGEGQFGTVLLVRDRDNSKPYALKCVAKQQTIKYKLQRHLKRQRQVLEKISSPFVVDYIRSFKDAYYIYFLMEYINGLELFDTIRLIGLLSIEQSRFYTAIMIHVLETIHSSMIVYRDLKPENIMVTKDGYLKIVDLGTCKQFETDSLHKTFTIIGTPTYMAPEILAGKGYTYNVDLWSLGVILYEFLAGYVPFGEDAEDPFEIYQEILTTSLKFPKHMNNVSANLLISQLLNKNPSMRLGGSYSKLKAHHFFNHFDWHALINKQMKAPYNLPPQKIVNQDNIRKALTKPVSSYLKFHGKPIGSRSDLDCKWDDVF